MRSGPSGRRPSAPGGVVASPAVRVLSPVCACAYGASVPGSVVVAGARNAGVVRQGSGIVPTTPPNIVAVPAAPNRHSGDVPAASPAATPAAAQPQHQGGDRTEQGFATSRGTPVDGESIDDYAKVRTVGRGSFGEALLVKHRVTGRVAVLKRVRIEAAGDSAAESAAREAQVLQRLKHPHIVEFFGAFADGRDTGSLCLLMAYCEGGDLQHRLQRLRHDDNRLSETQVLRWFDQLCSAVAYVHQHQVLHRDLKPSNIFLSGKGADRENNEESVAIGDFGVSRPLTHPLELVSTMVGTPCYLSPEVCKGKPYSYKSDIWSLGCVLFEMITLRPPFGAAPNLEALVSRIVRADFRVTENLEVEYPEVLRCVRAVLRLGPERRPTAQALLTRSSRQKNNVVSVDACGGSTNKLASCASPAHGQHRGSFDPAPRANAVNAGCSPGIPTRAALASAAAAAGAAAVANAVASAMSPRTRGRARLASRILESEVEQENAKAVLRECGTTNQRKNGYSPVAQRRVSAPSWGGCAELSGSRRRGTSAGSLPERNSPVQPSSNGKGQTSLAAVAAAAAGSSHLQGALSDGKVVVQTAGDTSSTPVSPVSLSAQQPQQAHQPARSSRVGAAVQGTASVPCPNPPVLISSPACGGRNVGAPGSPRRQAARPSERRLEEGLVQVTSLAAARYKAAELRQEAAIAAAATSARSPCAAGVCQKGPPESASIAVGSNNGTSAASPRKRRGGPTALALPVPGCQPPCSANASKGSCPISPSSSSPRKPPGIAVPGTGGEAIEFHLLSPRQKTGKNCTEGQSHANKQMLPANRRHSCTGVSVDQAAAFDDVDDGCKDDDDSKKRLRRENRTQQSQAFRVWLRRQRAAVVAEKRSASCDGMGDCSSPMGIQVASPRGPPNANAQPQRHSMAAVAGRQSASPKDVAAHDPGCQQQEVFFCASPVAALIPPQFVSVAHPPPLASTAVDGAPGGFFGVNTSPSATMLDSTGAAPSTGSGSCSGSCSLQPNSGTTGAINNLSRSNDAPCTGSPQLACRSVRSTGLNAGTGAADMDDYVAGELQDVESSCNVVSIGDRIEGIRACLEAKMGTQRFHKLYRSMMVEIAAKATTGVSDEELPCKSSVVLPKDMFEVFDDTVDGEAELNVLAPLVAKLVACENSYFS